MSIFLLPLFISMLALSLFLDFGVQDEGGEGTAGSDDEDLGPGDDTFDAGAGNDLVRGGYGFDDILGGSGGDMLWGDGGKDILIGGTGADILYGGGWHDGLSGNAGDDTLFGGSGEDILDGGADDDVLVGGDGDDYLIGGAGADTLLGGQGFDFLNGGNAYESELDLSTLSEVIRNDGPLPENLFPQGLDDEADYIDGGPGEDFLLLGPGDTAVDGDVVQDFIIIGDWILGHEPAEILSAHYQGPPEGEAWESDAVAERIIVYYNEADPMPALTFLEDGPDHTLIQLDGTTIARVEGDPTWVELGTYLLSY
ncbi:calcium-binding protein [Loktanella sp. IMCC34160]|uniref:calcium-binding protein n=1 Tax=Loktanella sp. IMCC34160 TaxID=2510646 RepID=UPI00101BFDF0|nr:calcium-binding protein [Loktanella sp. IMCC34160]RYG92619.1 calcium-binding protein [Loktanella sp. IMCC34160]